MLRRDVVRRARALVRQSRAAKGRVIVAEPVQWFHEARAIAAALVQLGGTIRPPRVYSVTVVEWDVDGETVGGLEWQARVILEMRRERAGAWQAADTVADIERGQG